MKRITLIWISLSSCLLFPAKKEAGAVHFFSRIPEGCNHVSGLKQSHVARFHSMKELEHHYGMTFHVWFQDGISPELYGTLYYQNRKENRYCMALPDGRIAMFSDRRVNGRPNVSHEICYPIKDCLGHPDEFSAAAGQRQNRASRDL